MDVTTLEAQIVNTKAQLAALNAAILALADPTVLEYTLDTGQTIERVKRNDLLDLIATQNALMNQLCTLEQRLTGGSTITVFPSC